MADSHSKDPFLTASFSKSPQSYFIDLYFIYNNYNYLNVSYLSIFYFIFSIYSLHPPPEFKIYEKKDKICYFMIVSLVPPTMSNKIISFFHMNLEPFQ